MEVKNIEIRKVIITEYNGNFSISIISIYLKH